MNMNTSNADGTRHSQLIATVILITNTIAERKNECGSELLPISSSR